MQSQSEELVIGFDIGTTAVKGVVLRLDGEQVFARRMPCPSNSPKPDWVEQDPETWMICVKKFIQARWRGQYSAAHGGDRQCDPRRHRIAPDRPADVAAARPGGAGRGARGVRGRRARRHGAVHRQYRPIRYSGRLSGHNGPNPARRPWHIVSHNRSWRLASGQGCFCEAWSYAPGAMWVSSPIWSIRPQGPSTF